MATNRGNVMQKSIMPSGVNRVSESTIKDLGTVFSKFESSINQLIKAIDENKRNEIKNNKNDNNKDKKNDKQDKDLREIKKQILDFAENSKINYLDNKYAKGNNLNSKTNEYSDALAKLKTSALDVYGKEFESNKDYKKALKELNNNFYKEYADEWKKDFKENHRILSSVADGVKDTFAKNTEVLGGFLGPLALFINPINSIFKGLSPIIKLMGGGFKSVFGRFIKKKPTASDVVKAGSFGVGSLYIVSEMKKLFKNKGKGDSDDEGGGIFRIIKKYSKDGKILNTIKKLPIIGTFLRSLSLLGKSFGKNFLGNLGKGGLKKFMSSGATKTALKGMGPMAIIMGLLEMVKDGIKGIFKSKEWGVDKIKGFFGSFLGGIDKGIKGAFKNMGKWALLGAGIGSVVPAIGTAIGGLVGALIGTILGFIGGERIAKFFGKVGEFFVFVGGKIKDFFVWIGNKIIGFFKWFFVDVCWGAIKKVGNTFGAIGGWFKDLFSSAWNGLKSAFSKAKEAIGTASSYIKDKFNSAKEGLMKVGNIVKDKFIVVKDKIADSFDLAKSGIKQFLSNPFGIIKTAFTNIKNTLMKRIKKIINSNKFLKKISSFGGKILSTLFDKLKKIFTDNPIAKFFEKHIITPFKKTFGIIGDFFGYINSLWDWEHPIDSLGNIIDGLSGNGFEAYRNKKYDEVDDAIIKTNGSIIKTNPKDTLVALKDIPLSTSEVAKKVNSSIETNSNMTNVNIESRLDKMINILTRLLDKNIQINMPQQTRYDLDMIMSGGMI